MKYDTNTVAGNLLKLMKFYVGQGQAKQRSVVLEYLHHWYPKLSDSEMRLAKEHLIEHGEPICSGPEGWWYAANASDADKGASFLEKRGRDLLMKAALIRAAADRLYGGQSELDFA